MALKDKLSSAMKSAMRKGDKIELSAKGRAEGKIVNKMVREARGE